MKHDTVLSYTDRAFDMLAVKRKEILLFQRHTNKTLRTISFFFYAFLLRCQEKESGLYFEFCGIGCLITAFALDAQPQDLLCEEGEEEEEDMFLSTS